VERGVERVSAEPDARFDVVEEGGGSEGQLDDVVEELEAGAVAEPHAELAESTRRQPIARSTPTVLADLADLAEMGAGAAGSGGAD